MVSELKKTGGEARDGMFETLTPRSRLEPVDEFLAFFTIAFFTEGALALFIYRGTITVPMFIVLHLVSVALLFGWMLSLRHRGIEYGLPGLLAFSTMTMGFIGVLGSLLMVVQLLLHRETKQLNGVSYHAVPKSQRPLRVRDLYNNIVSGREGFVTSIAVSSFIEIMTYGTHEQKQALIALLARHFQPEFAPALHRALIDDRSDIRVQAATAVTKIEQAYFAKWTTLKVKAEGDVNSFEARFALAQHLDDFAYLGLLDEEQKSEILDQAMVAYQQCERLATGNIDLAIAMGRLLVRRGEIEEAVKHFESLSLASLPISGVYWYGQALYMQKRYSDLRQLLSEWESATRQDINDVPANMRDVFGFWQKGWST